MANSFNNIPGFVLMVYTAVSCVRNYLKKKLHLQGAFYLHYTESSTFDKGR